MLLEWITGNMGLLSANPNSNFLKEFPYEVKKPIVKSLVTYFSQKYEHAMQQVKTDSHANFMMEVIGQSFTMNIEDHDVINMAIDVYHKWLFDEKNRPAPMKADPQKYIRKIFDHFSYLFEVRQGQSSAVLKDHIYLCNRVMDIFLQMGINRDLMDTESWYHVMKVALGVTDLTMRGNGLPELKYGLLKVLFDVWLCSLSRDADMWGHLQQYVMKWNKEMSVIRQWTAVCMALTLRVINLIYGPGEGTEFIRIQWIGLNPTNNPNQNVGNAVTELKTEEDDTIFCWNMFLHIIGNPNKIPDAEVHLRAFQGLQQITHQLAYVGADPPAEKIKNTKDFRMVYPPDGNSILRMFGPWFYEAVNRTSASFNEGKSVAYAALCRIFCRRGGRPFSQENLSLFYKALINGLNDDDTLVVSAIILNSCRIFSYELEGSHILIPHYTRVCERILCQEKPTQTYPEILRSACISLATSFICLPNHFAGGKNSKENMIYVELKFKVQNIFQKALLYEKSPRNIQHIIWSISMLLFEELKYNKDVAKPFLNTILDIFTKHASAPSASYNVDVNETILQFLSLITSLYPYLLSADIHVAATIADTIALQLPILTNYLAKNQALSELVSEGFYTLCDWIMVGCDRILADRDLVTHIISAVEIGLNADKLTKKSGPEIDNIKTAAEFVLCHMLNNVGHFPPTNENALVSSYKTEQTEALDGLEGDQSKFVRYFIFDDLFIFTVIDQPDEKGGPGATVIVRDVTGKFVWDAKLLYSPPPTPLHPPQPRGIYSGSSTKGLTGHVQENPENSTFVQFSQPPKLRDRPGINFFESLIDDEENMENAIATKLIDEELKTLDLSIKPPNVPYKFDAECKFQMSRLLLTHLGFFNLNITNRFCQLVPNQKMLRSLKYLDGAPERDTHKIGVLYVKEGQDLQTDILANEDGSERYTRFLASLGWSADLDSHLGFLGGLDKGGSVGTHAPFFADYKSEVIFHVPSMMPTSAKDNQQIHKKRHVGNDHVNVIWTEHTRDYYRNTVISQFNFVHIVVYPLQNGLLRVDVLVKDEQNTPIFGPLVSGSTVVSERILGILVRNTAMNSNRITRKASTGYQKPYVKRKQLILEMAGRYKAKMDTSKYFGSMFLSKSNFAALVDTPGK